MTAGVDVDELLLLDVLVDEDVDEFVNALELIDVVEDVEVLLEVGVVDVVVHGGQCRTCCGCA
eukprot:2278385-Amphidinium_carterae.1